MNQDMWTEIIQFLQPIDILASLLTIDRNVYELIKNSCFLHRDDICKFCSGVKTTIQISIIYDDISKIDHVQIIRNAKYIIRLHLLKLAFLLGDTQRDDAVVDELELLSFYRNVFYSNLKQVREQTINYMLIGESRVGKSTLLNYWQFGRSRNRSRIGCDFVTKKFSIPNEVNYVHRIFETNGQERFCYRDSFINQYVRFDMKYFLCFSMDHQESLDHLSEWYSEIRVSRTIDLGIIIGLHPRSSLTKKNPVNEQDAIQKAYSSYGSSVFVEVDVKNSKHIYVPLLFTQLHLAYFHTFKEDNTDILTKENKNVENNESYLSYCEIL